MVDTCKKYNKYFIFQVREQLVRASEVLTRVVQTLFPARRVAERERTRQTMVQHYHENKHAEHHRVLQRHKIIEERKEYIERLNTVREEEELRYIICIPCKPHKWYRLPEDAGYIHRLGLSYGQHIVIISREHVRC